jgi:hypothetical protein
MAVKQCCRSRTGTKDLVNAMSKGMIIELLTLLFSPTLGHVVLRFYSTVSGPVATILKYTPPATALDKRQLYQRRLDCRRIQCVTT